MKRWREQARLGLRWMQCGWRVLKRHPWVLLGMGFISLLVLLLSSLIPFAGGFLVAALTPLLVASALLTVHELGQQKPRPRASLAAKLSRPALELLRIFHDERHLLAVVMVSLYALIAMILIGIAGHLVSGGSWSADLSLLSLPTILRALGAWLVVLLLYVAVLASLIYGLPLICLHNEPLITALGHSLKLGLRHWPGVLVLVAIPFAPLLLGAITALFSTPVTYGVWLIGGSLVLPWFVTSSYCSYRTLFPSAGKSGK